MEKETDLLGFEIMNIKKARNNKERLDALEQHYFWLQQHCNAAIQDIKERITKTKGF